MAYFRKRRTQASDPSVYDEQEADLYSLDADDDRIYTEEDYAIPEQSMLSDDEAFLPDEEMYLPAEEEDGAGENSFDPFNIPESSHALGMRGFASLDDMVDTDDLDDPLDEEFLTDEELALLRRSRWKLLSGLADFAGVIVGTAVILLLVMLLVSLGNWLLADINQTFTLWQTRI